MRSMGSKKGWDPIPPDQYLTYMDKRYETWLRLWAWLLSKTIRPEHFSPHAIDERYNTLTLKDAESGLKASTQKIRDAWAVLEAEGRVHREGHELHVHGEVKLPDEESAQKVGTERFPSYILLQINKLASEKRTEFEAETERDEAFEKQVLADFTAGVRVIFDQKENTRFERFGLKKRREEHPVKKKGDAKRPDRVAKILPHIEEFVQQISFEFESVQTPDSSSHNGKTERRTKSASLSVSTPASALGSVSQSEGTDRPTAGREVSELLVAELSHKLPGEAPSLALCTRVVAELRGAPLENLRQAIKRRLSKFDSMGLAEHVAREVGNAWAAGAGERDRALIDRWVKAASWMDPELQAEARDALARSDASPEVRAMARQLIDHAKTHKSKGASS